jgi:tetratricopeptide (TPR) repeat protein
MINSVISSGYSTWGSLHYIFGDYKSAIDNYNVAIQINSEDETAYLNRGMARILTNDYQAAIEDLSKAIQINPQDAQAYAERGIARTNIGNNQIAVEDFNRAIELNSQYCRAYYGRGTAYSFMGEYEKSIADFTQLSRLEPQAYSYYNLACILYLQGLNGQVIKNTTKVLAVEASQIGFSTPLLSIIEILGTELMASHYPNSIKIGAYYLRGNAYYNLGDEQAANEDFQEAIQIENTGASEINAEDEHGLYARGLARHRLGNREGAISDLQTALEITLKHQDMTLHQKLIDLIDEVNPEI